MKGIAMAKTTKPSTYKLTFVRRNPKDPYWYFVLSKNATFTKTFRTTEDAAKFIADNTFLHWRVDDTAVNVKSKILLWEMDESISNRERQVIFNKVNALTKCRREVYDRRSLFGY